MVADATARRRGIAVVRWLAVAAVVLVLVIVLWNRGQDVIDGQTSNGLTYLLTTLLVFGDALVPVLPGETTLNAACVLAANGKLQLGLVMLCGAVGAVTGDSTLYWLARKATGRVRRWLDRAEQGQAGAKVKDLLGRHGRIFLLFGRYVPACGSR
jgi:membrane-associated protein